MIIQGMVEAIPSIAPDEWFIRRIGAQKSHRVSSNVVKVLAAALAEASADSAGLARLTDLSRSTVDACLALLTAQRYLAPEHGAEPQPHVRASLVYLVDTYDYPFEHYERGRNDSDRTRMAAYSAVHPDEDRARVFPRGRATLIELPLPSADIPPVATTSFLERVAILLAIAAVPTMKTPAPWPGQPLWRKTSPSGGSRHPTELYLRVSADPSAGTFYADPATRRVLAMDDCTDADDVARAQAQCEAAGRVSVIVTSRFARNMYRYREPRTFRTLFLDVGHVVGTLRLAASQLGLRVSHEPPPMSHDDRDWGAGQFDEFPSVSLDVSDEQKTR